MIIGRDVEFPSSCGITGRSELHVVQGKTRCLFVAGFIRIRSESRGGIRILTNPATLDKYGSEFSSRKILRILPMSPCLAD